MFFGGPGNLSGQRLKRKKKSHKTGKTSAYIDSHFYDVVELFVVCNLFVVFSLSV